VYASLKETKNQDPTVLRRAWEAEPDRSQALIALAKALPMAEAEPLYRDFLEKHPDDPDVRRSFAGLLEAGGRWREALQVFGDLKPEPEDSWLDEAWVQAGRGREALDRQPPDQDLNDRIWTARLRRLLGEDPVAGYEPALASVVSIYVGTTAGLDDLEKGAAPDLQRAIEANWWATHDPAKAWTAMANLPRSEDGSIYANARVLLGLEFVRAGDGVLGPALLDSVASVESDDWRAYLDPDRPLPPRVEQAGGTFRGVILYVRSRVRHQQGRYSEEQDLRVQAEKAEVVPGLVHLVLTQWPAPR
jgi:hypothetical protein